MNKEQKKFKKTIKAQKRSLRKKRTLAIERNSRKVDIAIAKIAFKKEKKEISEKRLDWRIKKIQELRKTLKIPDNITYTLEALEKKRDDSFAKQRARGVQTNLLNSVKRKNATAMSTNHRE